MHKRNVALCIVLTIVTCGIYGLYWMVCLNDDAIEVTGVGQTTGVMAVVFTIITCGIYGFYWCYKMGEKLDMARSKRGVPTGNQAILYLILSIFGLSIISWALIQSELNNYSATGDDL